MSDLKVKKVWRNRLSQQLHNFSLSACVLPNVVHEETNQPTTLALPPQDISKFKRALPSVCRRKPLPNDCPQFDFSNKTSVATTSAHPSWLPPPPPPPHQPEICVSLAEKTEIPTRHQSRHYENIPDLTSHLDRIRNNEKAILLAQLLHKQHQRQYH